MLKPLKAVTSSFIPSGILLARARHLHRQRLAAPKIHAPEVWYRRKKWSAPDDDPRYLQPVGLGLAIISVRGELSPEMTEKKTFILKGYLSDMISDMQSAGYWSVLAPNGARANHVQKGESSENTGSPRFLLYLHQNLQKLPIARLPCSTAFRSIARESPPSDMHEVYLNRSSPQRTRRVQNLLGQ